MNMNLIAMIAQGIEDIFWRS